jgi:sugar/nucleoside kinase (ribokinase family)
MYDIICIGSATVDAFISTGDRLFQKSHGDYCKVPFGSKILVDEVLFSTGGGGTNTSVGFSRLGHKAAFIGKIGLGTNSTRIMRELIHEKVDTYFVIRNRGRTGFSVVLDATGHDRTILAFKGSNNDISYDEIRKSRLKSKWFYFGSMMGKSFDTLTKLAAYAKAHKIKVAFNPSSYLAVKGPEHMKKILDVCNILILNKGEAQELLRKLSEKNIDKLLLGLYKLVPNIVVITDGEKGVYCYDGKFKYFAEALPVKVIEATGAGDAFSSGFVSGIMSGKTVEYSMQMGCSNAESVIAHFGAKNILLGSRQIASYIKQHPRKALKTELKNRC